MDDLHERLANWSASLPLEVDAGSLFARCPVAHKWKATFRAVLIRESSFWRMCDLGNSFLHLIDASDLLASRIILRCACETAALLAFLNSSTSDRIAGTSSFEKFNDLTKQLLLGGRNNGDYFKPIHVTKCVSQFAKDRPVIQDIYDRLSEDLHPNASGMIYAYSENNPAEFETRFLKKIASSEATKNHTIASADLIFRCYEEQYDNIWPRQFEALEQWLRDNDSKLQAAENVG
jgi:hypothetical protein